MSSDQNVLSLDGAIASPDGTGRAAIRPKGHPTILARIARASRRSPVGTVAIVFLLLVVGIVLLGPVLPIPDPQAPSLTDRLRGPFSRNADGTLHLLGTDQLGRDVLSRTIYGGRISLGVALAAVIVSGIFGTMLGLVAGYRGGIFDYAVMRLVVFQMAMPSLLLAIFLIYLLGPSLLNLVILLSVLSWSSYTRIVRSDTLGLRSADYVDAAIIGGANQRRILGKHILPQVLPVLGGRGFRFLGGDPGRSGHQLSRLRGAAAPNFVGTDDLRGTGVHHHRRLVALRRARRLDHPHRAQRAAGFVLGRTSARLAGQHADLIRTWVRYGAFLVAAECISAWSQGRDKLDHYQEWSIKHPRFA